MNSGGLNDSDDTPDSDELAVLICKKSNGKSMSSGKNASPPKRRPVHTVSESDTDSDDQVRKPKIQTATKSFKFLKTGNFNLRPSESGNYSGDQKPSPTKSSPIKDKAFRTKRSDSPLFVSESDSDIDKPPDFPRKRKCDTDSVKTSRTENLKSLTPVKSFKFLKAGHSGLRAPESDRNIEDPKRSPVVKSRTNKSDSPLFGSESDSDPDKSPELPQKRKFETGVLKTPRTEKSEALSPVKDKRPLCEYGRKCYRKSSEHLKLFRHSADDSSERNSSSAPSLPPPDVTTKNIYGFYVTKVAGIDQKYNSDNIAVGIKDLLSATMGTLKASVQFSYMFDVSWLMDQFPDKFRSCPLLLVHGEQRESKRELEKQGKPFPNITFCQAKLPILYGTHHTKMMLLLYVEGFRIVIHTANMVPYDWLNKTQGVWVSPLFPKCSSKTPNNGESPTGFKADLLQYLKAYESPQLQPWCQHLQDHDLSSVRVFLIGSIPGRHTETRKSWFGHLKFRKLLLKFGPDQETVGSNWPILGQFSSIGSLGASPEDWLRGEWLTSLATRKATLTGHAQTSLKLVYPSVDDVRLSLEGYPAGSSLPYSVFTAAKQPYLRNFMYRWRSEVRCRTVASPHIKTYMRLSPDNSQMAWFLVTSANLSKAAWGMSEKKGDQLMVRSYELGVLFLPAFHKSEKSFPLTGAKAFPVPFDVPIQKYTEKDFPWMWDIPHTKFPDRHGNMWCPPPLK